MEIHKIQILIRSFLHETKDVVESPEESQRWLRKFRDTLNYQDLETDPLPYALVLLQEADNFNKSQKMKQMMRWAKFELAQEGIKEPSKEQILNKCKEKYQDEFETLSETEEPPQPQKPQQPPQKQPVVRPPQKKSHPMPNDSQEVLNWAADNNLDVDDAYECWQATTERNGCDADGKPVNDWKAFVTKWCKSRAENRKRSA